MSRKFLYFGLALLQVPMALSLAYTIVRESASGAMNVVLLCVCVFAIGWVSALGVRDVLDDE